METLIRKSYSNAKKGSELVKDWMDLLVRQHQFDPSATLLATSVCSDEVNRTSLNFHDYLDHSSPFEMGGLAGYPFTGRTGLGAFLSHIPDGGGAIILYGPHIGVSGSGDAGFVKRVGQKEHTTCCGALQATLATLQDSSGPTSDRDLDGQMWNIESELAAEREAFLESETPIVAVTDVMYRKIDERVTRLASDVAQSF
ncbi:MAG: hypothetical protein WD315_01415, partial [Balneolaceae bacterium]